MIMFTLLVMIEVKYKVLTHFKNQINSFSVVLCTLSLIMATDKYAALFPHVAKRSRELIHILVHGAANLPQIEGRNPRCYVTA
jgi:hypothetical protein